METPSSTINDYRPSSRSYTPRLSARKKKLFSSNNSPRSGAAALKQHDDDDDDPNLGLTPLRSKRHSQRQHLMAAAGTPKSKRNIEAQLVKSVTRGQVVGFQSTESESDNMMESPKRRSIRLKNNSPGNKENEATGATPPPMPSSPEEQQLQQLFNESLTFQKKQQQQQLLHDRSLTIAETSEEEASADEQLAAAQKRHLLAHEKSTGESPKSKVTKLTSAISTKSFYSAPKLTPQSSYLKPIRHNTPSTQTTKTSPRSRRSLKQSSAINRGVRHKIRKRPHQHNGHPQQHPTHHSVDLDVILGNLRNEKLRALITNKRQERAQIEKLHNIFRQAENPIEMARPLSVLSNDDKNNNNNNNNSGLSNKNSEIGDCGSSYADELDFSDIDYDSDGADFEDDDDADAASVVTREEVIPIITHQLTEEPRSPEPLPNRKFFKSKRTNVMEVRITENIRASVCQGKISLVEEKKKRRPRPRRRSANIEFADEQATVDAILKNLDDTAFGDMPVEPSVTPSLAGSTQDLTSSDDQMQQMELYNNDLLNDIQLEDNNDYADFRKRLPYNTDDPALIEQQHLLLDFLISNNICTEENFNIFIADPDNHKEEASRIIDGVVLVLNQEQVKYRDMLPYNTSDPALIEQQYQFLNFLMENDICDAEHFDIFIANYETRQAEAEAIIKRINMEVELEQGAKEVIAAKSRDQSEIPHTEFSSLVPTRSSPPPAAAPPLPPAAQPESNKNNLDKASEPSAGDKLFPIFTNPSTGIRSQPLSIPKSTRHRQWQGGYGSKQLQIDAGQKQFGATQCKQCGLLYTMHEPEEERLHREYHASLHVLRFKGWIDEDIVAIYPEWGNDGRILRLQQNSPPKRKERLMEILKIVDRELGFAHYIMPRFFVAYMAVRRNQIVGVCLAQPLQKANKYLCINGVDCCTEETFDVKCGISRIWVSPLHRRLHIAAKLVNAVQLNTILGEDIPFDKLAFSAPTEMGRVFAQKLTGMENFLVYQ